MSWAEEPQRESRISTIQDRFEGPPRLTLVRSLVHREYVAREREVALAPPTGGWISHAVDLSRQEGRR